jgi:DNA-binding response OmpR family regulator
MTRTRVLVVEDDPDTLEAIAEALRDEFDVSLARSGEDALELAARRAFDVLVVDLDLGLGIGGAEFAGEYRRRANGPTPIIVVSGLTGAAELALPLDPAAVLAKPYDVDELVTTIRDLSRRGP